MSGQSINVTIRPPQVADVRALAAMQCELALETEGLHLDRSTVEAGVRSAVVEGRDARYFIAERSGAIVGMLMTTREWSDWRNGWYCWIQSVFVQPGSRRTGVFTNLLRAVQREAASDDTVIGLRLYVEHENDRAIATYRRHGFAASGYHVLEQLNTTNDDD